VTFGLGLALFGLGLGLVTVGIGLAVFGLGLCGLVTFGLGLALFGLRLCGLVNITVSVGLISDLWLLLMIEPDNVCDCDSTQRYCFLIDIITVPDVLYYCTYVNA